MPGMRQILLAVALVLVVPARAQDDFRSEVLAAHNAERAKAGLPPLVWDPVLAGQAGGWARRLAGRRPKGLVMPLKDMAQQQGRQEAGLAAVTDPERVSVRRVVAAVDEDVSA